MYVCEGSRAALIHEAIFDRMSEIQFCFLLCKMAVPLF